jgi:hypothetical protein
VYWRTLQKLYGLGPFVHVPCVCRAPDAYFQPLLFSSAMTASGESVESVLHIECNSSGRVEGRGVAGCRLRIRFGSKLSMILLHKDFSLFATVQ